MLEDILKPLAMSQAEAARRLGIHLNRLNEIVVGKRGMSADTALRLDRVFGIEAQFWLDLQQTRDLFDAGLGPAGKKIRGLRPTARASVLAGRASRVKAKRSA